MTESLKMALAADTGVAQDRIDALAAQTNLPLVSLDHPAADLILVQTSDRLELRQTGKGAPGPVYADFVSGKAAHRRLEGIGRKQPLARAVGIRPGECPSIIDATAGLGQDALVLATLGCQVILIERSPVVAALLADAIARALANAETAPIAARIQLIQTDARHHLAGLSEAQRPDVVYLDPMFPKRHKSALVKKEMRLFQQLPDTMDNADDLLPLALAAARKRVTVKRPAKAAWLADIEPSISIHSPKMRFDVYLRSKN